MPRVESKRGCSSVDRASVFGTGAFPVQRHNSGRHSESTHAISQVLGGGCTPRRLGYGVAI